MLFDGDFAYLKNYKIEPNQSPMLIEGKKGLHRGVKLSS